MQIAGIVAEYNPFHTGHAYQISQTRKLLGQDTAIIAVMSGNWVQQGGCAIGDKWLRARLALMGGADLVLELPTVWAASTAESFARGAVDILNGTGVADVLSFGSECGDVERLKCVAACLDSPSYREKLGRYLNQGLTFAACRQTAVEELIGQDMGGLLATPNNNLGVEYIRALNGRNSTIRPITVLRQGAAHNSISDEVQEFVSATQIRRDLLESRQDRIAGYLDPAALEWLKELPSMANIERALLLLLRGMTAEMWEKIPDSGAAEGLPQRLVRAGRQCTSVEEFFELTKTKRYTRARLNRLLLWAYLGIRDQDVPDSPPYIRVLGFNSIGQEVLKEMKKRAALPVVTKPAHGKELDDRGRRLFEIESKCTDLYDLCFERIKTPGREWTTGPVIIK